MYRVVGISMESVLVEFLDCNSYSTDYTFLGRYGYVREFVVYCSKTEND